MRPGPGRHGRVLCRVRVRPGGFGQHDRGHRQVRSAAVRGLRDARRRTGSTSTATVRDRLGTRKASFAPAEETAALTGMQMGGVTVFGLPAGLPIWVDSRVMERERIVLGGGSRSWKVDRPAVDPAVAARRSRSSRVWPTTHRRPDDGSAGPHPARRGRRPADLPRPPGRPDRGGDGCLPDPRPPDVFFAHWAKIRADPTNFTRTIVADGEVVGDIVSWLDEDGREVGYWIGRESLGQAATRLRRSDSCSSRSRIARSRLTSSAHNIGSQRVVEHCGFVRVGRGGRG